MIEAIGNHQYYEKMDGSRRIVLRNRKHLKPVEYFKVRDPVIERPMIKEQVRNDRSLENEKPDKFNKVVEELFLLLLPTEQPGLEVQVPDLEIKLKKRRESVQSEARRGASAGAFSRRRLEK